MDARKHARDEKKRQLLRELAELQVEEMAESGDFDQTPHFNTIGRAGRGLGRELSCMIQERASREATAECDAEATCPTCETLCDVTMKRRTIQDIDGPIELSEATAYCRKCRRSFFPSADGSGAQ